MRKIIAIIIVVILLATSIGSAMIIANNNNTKHDGNNTVTVEDMLGVEVTVKKNPKVACSSRMTYDLLIAFGLKEYVDGGQYAIYNNPWTTVLNPDAVNDYSYAYLEGYETFYARGIDLVFAPEAYLANNFREHGITAMTVSLYGNPDYSGYLYYLADLANVLWDGISDKVIKWKNEFKTAIDGITAVLDDKGRMTKDLYYVRGDKNWGICYTDTGKSFCEWSCKFFGLNYVGSSFESATPSAEALLATDPDIIMIGGIHQHTLESYLQDSTWSEMSAVRDGNIFTIPVGISPLEQISTFSPVYLYYLANMLYPDDFHYDIETMIKETCLDYFGVLLTDEQVGYMIGGLDPEGNSLV